MELEMVLQQALAPDGAFGDYSDKTKNIYSTMNDKTTEYFGTFIATASAEFHDALKTDGLNE